MSMRRSAGKELDGQGAVDQDAGAEGIDRQNGHDKHESHKKRSRRDECCRQVVLSDEWKGAMLGVVSITPVLAVLLGMPKGLPHFCYTWESQAKHYLAALYISVMFLYNFASCQFTDPGGTSKAKPTCESTGQFQMVFRDDDENDSKYKQVGSDEPLLYAANYCNHCKAWKPPRTHHCSFCRRCTMRMDHHCPFTGNCIGMYNHGHFFLMYVWAMVGTAYSFYLCAAAVYYSHNLAERMGKLGRPPKLSDVGVLGMMKASLLQLYSFTDFAVGVQLIVTCVALMAVFGMGSTAVYQVLMGRTMLETNFPMKEYVQIKTQVFLPLGNGFYSQGWRQNVRDVLGPSWLRRLVLPVRGEPVEWHVGVAPRPSVTGAKAILEQIEKAASSSAAEQG